jgi:hypothetical protein
MKQYFTGYGSGAVPGQGTLRQSGSGGGARFTERDAYKAEPRSYAANPGGVSQLGGHYGDHAMDSGGKILRGAAEPLVDGPGYAAKGPRPCVVGVGGGRDVQRSGSQGLHGPTVGQRPEETPKSFPIYGEGPGRRY